jgi:hypothetical protein
MNNSFSLSKLERFFKVANASGIVQVYVNITAAHCASALLTEGVVEFTV